jgi:hypothetical protein
VPGSTVQRVCVKVDGSTFPYTPDACWTCESWTGYMVRNGYFTAGDPAEDGDVGGYPGHWKNSDAQQVLVGLIRKSDCAKVDPRNGNVTGVAIDPPYMEKRTVVTPCPSPSPTPSPGPTPTPPPSGCPVVSQVGGSFLTARDCGKKCVDQGYLGYVVNVTSTELCQNGTPGCSCDPARNRCETPKTCQDPRGSTVYLSLPGHFSHDLADERSDNPWNHQHKPKAAETGVTEFLHCPFHAPWTDGRCTPKCMDIQKAGPREVPCR